MGCVLTAVALLVMLASVAPANALPNFAVGVNTNSVWTWGWPAGATVILTIDDPTTPTNPGYESDPKTAPPDGEGFGFDLGSFDVQPGHYVELTDGLTTEHHTVMDVALTWVDYDDDIVYGTAPSETEVGLVIIETHFPYIEHFKDDAATTADTEGNWHVDLGAMSMGYNIIPGMGIEAKWTDNEWDFTSFSWDPTFNVGVTSDDVWTWGWPAGATVILTIDDPTTPTNPDYESDPQTAPPDGDGFLFDLGSFDVQPGHLVTLSDGMTNVPHEVTNVSVTCASAYTGILTGTAEPDTVVWVDNGHGQNEQVTADEDGNWVAGPFSPHDLYEGGSAQQRDQVQNGTLISWSFADEFCVSIPVEIDIKPGSDPNCIKVSKKGSTHVAILASVALDVNAIDVSTIQIDNDDVPGGGIACVKSSTKKDVNKDGLPDLVCHFSTPDMDSAGLLVDGNTLYITGTLTDGTTIIGSDIINLAGGPYCF